LLSKAYPSPRFLVSHFQQRNNWFSLAFVLFHLWFHESYLQVAFCWHSQEDSNKCAILYNMTLSSITPCINIMHSLPKQHQISESILLSLHFAVHYSRTAVFSVCVNFIGFVFVPGYKRVVSADDARRIASVSDETRPSLPLDQTESCGLREHADDLFMEFPLSE
jgi:hypothetical protein